jgi:hypothetical protein
LDNKIATGIRVDAMEKRGRQRGKGGPQRGSPMRMIFGIFPLLAIPIVIYNMMALTARRAQPTCTLAPSNAIAICELG